MRTVVTVLAGFAACAVLALAAAGCSTEQISLSLAVGATPNPVAGVADPGGRRWDYRVSIANPNPVGVRVEYYHTEITGTDTGFTQPLQSVTESEIIGQWIAAGKTVSYPANLISNGSFTRGRERRLYHARGDDGRYYSGEVVVVLQ
jgi:hypothetical protein